MEIVKSIENGEAKFSLYQDYNITPIGIGKVYEGENEVKINVINVSRGYRSKGYGTLILKSIIETYQNKKITVTTFSHLVRWYMKFGFKEKSKNGNIHKLEKNANS